MWGNVKLPPGPTGPLPLRTFYALYRNPLTALQSLAQTYGDLVVFHIGRQPVYLLNHPDLVEAILVTNSRQTSKRLGSRLLHRLMGGLATSYAEEHLKERRMLQPVFHRRHLAGFGETMVTCTRQSLEGWQDGDTLDIFEEMTNLTLAIVGKTLFSSEFDQEAGQIRLALAVILRRMHVASMVLGEMAGDLPLAMAARTRKAVNDLHASIDQVIAERRIRDEQGDLLSLLMEAEGENGKLSDLQVRDQAMSIFLAGFETMAVALTWTLYLLSQHPDVEARLQAEIDQVLAGRLPTAGDFPNLKYTRQALSEALRLYPPLWAHGRCLAGAVRLGEWELPAGSFVIINHWLVHHDPRFFADPESFDPQRWAEDAAVKRPRLAFFPFGAGPRQCIGEGFAWMEGVLALATIAQSWQLRLRPGHRVEMHPVLILRPRYGMQMTLTRRSGPETNAPVSQPAELAPNP